MGERQRKDWAEIYQAITDQVPVNIEDSIIEVTEALRHGVVARELSFKNCIVRGLLTATRVTFAESVSFIDTIFEDGLDLGGCSVKGYIVAQNVEFRSNANFEGISIVGHTYFEQCTFKTNPDFATASFGSYTSFQGSTFEDGGSFISATFAGHLMLTNIPKCVGKFDLTWAAVAGTLSIINSAFDGVLSCYGARIGSTVLISETNFGPNATLSLEQAAVTGDVVIQKCTFDKMSGYGLNLSGIVVSGGCDIQRITCEGEFSLFNARVSHHLRIGTVNLEDVIATERETFFLRTFSIASLQLDGYFWCTGTVFGNEEEADPPAFSDVRIDGQTYIMGCDFKRGANFNRADFRGVFGTNAHFERQVTFEGARFQKGVRFLPGCLFGDGVELYFAEFNEEANFGGAKIRKRLSLRYAQFRHSLLFELKRSSEQGEGVPEVVDFQDDADNKVMVALRGCSYARLVLPYEFGRLQDFVDRVPDDDKNSLIYLEQYLRKSDRREQANYVRFHWNRLEGLRMPRFRPRWWLNRFHKYINRYGTVVSPLIGFALVFAVFGIVVDYVPRLHSWAKVIQTICWTAATLATALIADVIRRKVWPE